jgi:hypothetical protein
MATAKTGSFFLTETVTLASTATAGDRIQGSLDLGAYVNVATGQCIAIEEVDFIWQAGDEYTQCGKQMITATGSLSAQLTDLNPGTVFVRADDASLVASAGLNISTDDQLGNQTQSILSHQADFYPDNYGPTSLSEAFLVVNDTLYLVAGPDDADISSKAVYLTARIKCRVARLSTKDWMAIAIQSTASDN